MLNIYFISKVLKMHFTLFSCLGNSNFNIFTRQMDVLCMNHINSKAVISVISLYLFIYLFTHLFIFYLFMYLYLTYTFFLLNFISAP